MADVWMKKKLGPAYDLSNFLYFVSLLLRLIFFLLIHLLRLLQKTKMIIVHELDELSACARMQGSFNLV